jgi:D-alanyl-D-alanine carboxypeptidase/D-alanyl-D-alanine-endopeptidase (penicillin-binding protein 4)
VVGLAAEIQAIVARLERTTEVSVHIRELASDDVLFDYHGDAPLNPASNHKLLTTAAALDLLGPEFRFETRALRAGDALYVIGEGDPTLDELALRAMAAEIAAATDLGSLRRLVVDDLAFSPRTLAPGFNDEGRGCVVPGAERGAEPQLQHRRGDGPGAAQASEAARRSPRLEVSLWPPSTHVVALDLAAVGRGKLAIRTYAGLPVDEQARTVVELTGKLRAGRSLTVRRRVVDPGLYTGGALAVMLSEGTGAAPVAVNAGPRRGAEDRRWWCCGASRRR